MRINGSGVSITGTISVSGATTCSSTLAITGATTCSSTFSITGATTCSSSLTVSGTSYLSNSVGMGTTSLFSLFGGYMPPSPSGLDIYGNNSFDGSCVLRLYNNASQYGRTQLVLIGRNENSNDAWTLKDGRNNIVFGSQPSVGGTITYNNAIQSYAGSLGFFSNSYSTSAPALIISSVGDTSVRNTLSVVGAATLSSTLNVNGDIINGNWRLRNDSDWLRLYTSNNSGYFGLAALNLWCSSALTVGGSGSIGGDLTVSGNVLNANVCKRSFFSFSPTYMAGIGYRYQFDINSYLTTNLSDNGKAFRITIWGSSNDFGDSNLPILNYIFFLSSYAGQKKVFTNISSRGCSLNIGAAWNYLLYVSPNAYACNCCIEPISAAQ